MADCGDVLSLADLQTAKKHQLFEAEVITGKAGGVSTGADISFATNTATGQVQKTLPAVLAGLESNTMTWPASVGGTLTDATQVFLNDISGSIGIGGYFAWSGSFPHIVAPGTDPAITAGYVQITELSKSVSFSAMKRALAEAGLNLVAGSFEDGATLTTATDAILNIVDGKTYTWGGAFPKTVPIVSSPASTGGIGAGAWELTDSTLLRNTVLSYQAQITAAQDSADRALLLIDSVRIDVPSATTVNLTSLAPDTRNINITGTAAITGFTIATGLLYHVRFNGAATLTNGAGLVTNSGANITTAAGDTCVIRATAANTVEIIGYSPAGIAARMTALEARKSTCLVNATGTGAPHETVSTTLPANITTNTRYVLVNPFGANVPVDCRAEVLLNGKWSSSAWMFINGTGSYGVNATYVQGEGIIVMTGTLRVATASSNNGAGYINTSEITSAPCRVFVRRIDD